MMAPDTEDSPTFEPGQLGPAGRLMGRLGFSPAAHWRETQLAAVFTPIHEFMHRSASGGIVLIIATLLALVLANSPLGASYEHVLHLDISLTAGDFSLRHSVLEWINDGLMAIFFLLVGLEIKREVIVGELSDARAALLPVVAAFGGAVVPALIYTVINLGGTGGRGWAVPMATDIAFTLGVLALLGQRVPLALKIFLTAVAIADDLMAVLVIALFYAKGVHFAPLAFAFGVLALLGVCNFLGVRSLWVYGLLGIVVWFGFLESGVHATIAGVLVAWTIPARIRLYPKKFVAQARRILTHFEDTLIAPEGEAEDGEQPLAPMLTNERQHVKIAELEELCEGVQSPLQRLEGALHAPVAFGILPIFALANAGVALSLAGWGGDGARIAGGIVLGLLLGKPIGLLLATFLLVRSGASSLPEGVTWKQMAGASVLCGIGFTMSLFVASLGFVDYARLESAKTGILLASVLAGFLGYILLVKLEPEKAVSA